MKTIKNYVLAIISLVIFSASGQNKAFEVSIVGTGDPILFFPGFTCPGEVWEDVVAELSKSNTCHVFTFAGFGTVPAIERPWLPKIKEGISQYISENQLQNATIVGHSLGGTLGLWLASDDLFDFKKIIVVDALPSTGALMIPNFDSETIVYDNPFNQSLLTMDDDNFELMATQMASAMTLNKNKHEQIKNWILQTDRETYVYGYTDLLKLDLREAVANITVPVTILAATQPYGETSVKTIYEEQYKNLKGYTIKYAADAAHFIMYDQPDWLLTNISQALQ
ncbi:alpha/beta hydrolase [Gelidibacter japonicus]|uniref:alpha/beta fold hydrolase n=1 Tax=Gelidibacter japonicus TaxID=1962232 RepID=UPI0020218A51|nr:alpha/beta hydrolase [Gelidibacter japonicus]MCL8008079.1 alpha/beta hydrolase [Gelidibacter japonicus]